MGAASASASGRTTASRRPAAACSAASGSSAAGPARSDRNRRPQSANRDVPRRRAARHPPAAGVVRHPGARLLERPQLPPLRPGREPLDDGRRDHPPHLDAEPHDRDLSLLVRLASHTQGVVHGGGAAATDSGPLPRAEGRREDAGGRATDDSALELRSWTYPLRALEATEGSGREPIPARGSRRCAAERR